VFQKTIQPSHLYVFLTDKDIIALHLFNNDEDDKKDKIVIGIIFCFELRLRSFHSVADNDAIFLKQYLST